MRSRLTLLLLLAGVIALTLCAPADAAPAASQAWTRTNPVLTFLSEPGRIFVAADLGGESARSFVRVNLPEGATSGTLRLTAAAGSAIAGEEGDGAAMAACPLLTPIPRDGELTPEVAPLVDCSRPIAARRAGPGAWVVPLDAFATSWSEGPNHGLALVPTAGGTSTFRLIFDVAMTSATFAASSPVVGAVALVGPPTDGGGDLAVAGPEVEAPATPSPVPDVAATAAHDDVDTGAARDTEVAASTLSAPEAAPEPLRVPSNRVPAALVVVAASALALVGAAVASRREPSPTPRVVRVPAVAAGSSAAAVATVVLPALLSETNVYKLGLVLVLIVAAIGLHVLVTWTGELSLAHATMVGLPAFVVAKVAVDHGVSVILLLPLGVAVGLATGALIGLPAIRARGLQVALVTLAAGVAIDRFLFTREWLVGDVSGAQVPVPRLGPLTLASARSLYPVLAIVTIASVGAAWALYRSKVGRGLLWIKAQPDAAAAFGIPVARYRTMAYAVAGGFAGLSGGLTAMWVQRLTPQAFPLSRSFTYLIIVALAGRGFVGGVIAAALMVEGGRLFIASGDAFITYAAPIGLIFTLVRHQSGLNGLGRQLLVRITTLTRGGLPMSLVIRPLLAAGSVITAVGFTAIALAWYHAGNTSQVWVQNQEMISGGIGGLALVLVGIGVVLYDRVLAIRAIDAARWERLIEGT